MRDAVDDESRAAAAATDAPAFLALVDRDGNAHWMNRQLGLGLAARDRPGGRTWLGVLRDDDRTRVLRALARGEPFELDVRTVRAGDRPSWLAMRASLRGDGMFVVSAVDVSRERDARRVLQLLAAVGDELTAPLAIDESLEGVASLLAGEIADLCTIAVQRHNGYIDRIAIAHADKEIENEARALMPREIGIDEPAAIAEVLRTGTMLYRPLVDAPGPDEPWPPWPDGLAPDRPRSLICTPLRTTGDVVGALTLVSWQHRYTPDDVGLAQEIAHRCAAAVDNAAWFRQSEDARARLSLVATVGEQLAATVEVDEMLDVLTARVVPLFADAAVIALLDEEQGVLQRRAVRHTDRGREEAFRRTQFPVPISLDDRVPPARAARTGRPVLIEDYRRISDAAATMLEVASVLSVPLLARGRSVGVMTFAFTNSGRTYSSADLPLALDLARRAALAIERARVYEEERRIAETLQRSMLPDELPDVPGLSLHARYLPGGQVDVGGDWYDVIPLPAGRYGVAIGDVAGHGVRAAAVMGQLRHALRAFAADGHDPATVVSRLNRFVFEQGPDDLATLCYGVVDPMRGRFEMTVAGHMPPVLKTPDGAVRLLDTRPAPPIGADVSSRYTSDIVELERGATLVFFTDGLVERRGEVLDVGFERVIDALMFGPQMLDELCDRMIDALLGDDRPPDDVAVLGVRYVGAERGHFRIRRNARPAELAPVRRILAAWLETAGVGADEIGSVSVATSEAATNAIEHAYGPHEGWFEVEADVASDLMVTIVVRDGGRWRPKARGGGGRGLGLIARLMDDFEVRRRPAGTEIWMQRRARGKRNDI